MSAVVIESVQTGWAAEMAQQLGVVFTKPEALNVISGTHMVEGENRLPQVVL